MTVTETPVRPGRGAGRPPAEFPSRPATPFGHRAMNLVLLGLLGAAIWSIIDLKINLATMTDGLGYAVAFLARVVPLDFPPLGEIITMVGQTLAIVVCATVLSVLLSIPVALLAARNTTVNQVTRGGARLIIVIARALPELILAMFFLRIFGLGAIAGVLALGLHSVGMVGKLYADAIEELDPGPREALRATGATKLQQITGAILPPLGPAFVATALHRFDINLRGSVILGFVGVGGIGLEIAGALNTMNYRRGLALAMILLVICLITEVVSGLIRMALLGRAAPRRSPLAWLRRLTDRADRNSGGWVRGTGHAGPRGTGSGGSGSTAVGTGGIGTRGIGSKGIGSGASDQRRISPPWTGDRIRRTISYLLTAVVIGASLAGAQISPEQLAGGLQQATHIMSLYLPPGLGGIGDKLFAAMLETVQMGLAGTLIGLVTAIPVGILAARNVAPRPGIATFFRVIIVSVRAFPDLIIAICIVVLTGLGPVAGALALSFGAVGFLSKIIADSIEETDLAVQDAVRSGGGDGPQVFVAATLRQAAPSVVSHVMHQLDVNVRGATSLGVVGAGGIGYYMTNANRVLNYQVVTSCMIMILVVILAIEALALWVRHRVS
ncbi:phosphonate ABC transporter, permease protein PhnE [Microlunatus speluncae]|uniref:phosphonate ABC transporter, permease protein PhnE n=1 Tax=Microlunatus speluncae TaxID=2594267 RepID=UPI001C2D9400|nr:phosphonate ABC transporter, permease protein PhnE [Microlunatus speluncae]